MSISEQNLDPARGGVRGFVSTHWSVVLTAREGDSNQAAQALETLCRAYWYPLYSFVRRRGYAAEEARDLTQEFFTRLLAGDGLASVDRAKGRFRSFLLASMNHLLANEWNRAHCQKRGGHAAHLSLDAIEAEDRYRLEPVDELSPDKLFERRWAETLLDRVIERLRAEWESRPRSQPFDDLKAFLLDPRGETPFDQVARRLGVPASTVKSAVQKLRRRYREIFHEEIAHTVASPNEVAEEARRLFDALGS